MAETTEHGSNSWLAFVVGALLVGVLVIGYMMFTGKSVDNTQKHEFDFKVETPNLPVPNLPAPTPAPAPAAPAQ
jgi:hypothetical protein